MNTYSHNEMVRIVKDYKDSHPNGVISVQDYNDVYYEDIISSVEMFRNDYQGQKYRYYRIEVFGIVVCVA